MSMLTVGKAIVYDKTKHGGIDMSISELPINVNGKLTGDAKKQLMIVIEGEFRNKTSLYSMAQQAEKDKIVESYRKKVGYDAMKRAVDKAEEAVDKANKHKALADQAICAVGLQEDGTVGHSHKQVYYNGKYQNIENREAIALHKKLETLEANAPSESLRAKLVSRLWLASTIGEGNEIMREVLGNGVIPKTDIKAITFEG